MAMDKSIGYKNASWSVIRLLGIVNGKETIVARHECGFELVTAAIAIKRTNLSCSQCHRQARNYAGLANARDPGLYCATITIPGSEQVIGRYYGESVSVSARIKQHLADLDHHHCLRLRRLHQKGYDFVWKPISIGTHWNELSTRLKRETELIRGDEWSINTKGNEYRSASGSVMLLPMKERYKGRRLHILSDRGVIWVRTEDKEQLLGIEMLRGKIRSGFYISDEACGLRKL